MALHLPPIYPITDKRLAQKPSHLAVMRELVRGGATLVQVRDKETPLPLLLADLRRCAEFAAEREVTLIVNDRCDLALASGAAGVHLGQDDLPSLPARRLLGRSAVIGLSTHSALEVRRAAALPVDYIGFGPVFPTSSKPEASPVAGTLRLRAACRISEHPVVAIGGIGLEQVSAVIEAGAESAAVVSALMTAGSIAREMERFLRTGEQARIRSG